LNNAVKFTEAGSISLNINVKFSASESGQNCCEVTISVVDTGIGIAEEKQQQHLFDPFMQADVSTTRKYGGSGLGLAIVHKMVTLLEGGILLSSTEGQGSEFIVRVPLALAEPNLAKTALKPVVITLIETQFYVSGSVLAIQLKQLGYQIECMSYAQYLQLNRTHQNSYLLLFSNDCLESALLWYKESWQVQHITVAAYCSNSIENNEMAEQLRKMASISVSQNGLELVEQIEMLINKNSMVADLGELSDEALVLVVEDNPVNLMMAQNILKQLGIKSISATNGQQAIDLFKVETLTLILMDCQMPVMNGFLATQKIRQIEQQKGGHIPIIALTANAFKEDKDACLAAGMDEYLSKPFKKKQLLEIMGPWLKIDFDNKEQARKEKLGLNNAYAVLDDMLLEELMALDEENSILFITELSAVFFRNAEQLMPKIEKAFSQQAIHSVAKLAHQLKSSSMNVAAKRLSDLFKKLETSAKEGGNKEAIKLWLQINAEYHLVEKAYRQLLNN
jgi:CheY-like chemotaxis protein